MIHTPITANLPIAEAARLMMAEQLAIVYEHLPALQQDAAVTAVHETRKAIRRTFTLFKLFAPSFAPGELEPHRRTLRRLMRRLAPCRDLARRPNCRCWGWPNTSRIARPRPTAGCGAIWNGPKSTNG